MTEKTGRNEERSKERIESKQSVGKKKRRKRKSEKKQERGSCSMNMEDADLFSTHAT
jgi:hypothetical protein